MRQQRRFSQILGLSVAAALLVALVIVTHSLVKDAIAARTSGSICLSPQTPLPVCYGLPKSLASQAITALTATTDGQLFANSKGKTIQIWSMPPIRLTTTLTGHTDWITDLAFSPDKTLLASSSLDQTIKLWNVTNGTLLTSLKSGRVTSLAFSPDGTRLASGSRLRHWADGATSPDGIQVWDVATQQLVYTLDARLVNDLAFSPDGRSLAAGAQKTTLWNLATGTKLFTFDSGKLNALSFVDRQILITGSDGVKGQGGIKLWNVESGQFIRAIDSVGSHVAVSPDRRLFATTYGGTINLWRIQPSGFLGTLRGSQYSGMFVEFGADQRTLIGGGSDGIYLWQPTTSVEKQ
ncbi:WD40 repeat domain-containing protein [Phormidium sp. CLA17]|uniref:WD40 repeat domain-containing protein n=1 Tax=Leptolyngbya sp. Cla-17 TaxID=2803751 RepID=UPI001492B074|nr:WD40 repeat domain-containing protein [Leptolyngbya sp. Cla-17]MBM0741462.1 WD40 repeat domain-containing protein [Leptolyngbya sp. Cla-17]